MASWERSSSTEVVETTPMSTQLAVPASRYCHLPDVVAAEVTAMPGEVQASTSVTEAPSSVETRLPAGLVAPGATGVMGGLPPTSMTGASLTGLTEATANVCTV